MGETWSSRAMFVLAAIGSAVGLGNIWRFSYMAGQHGGGSFIVLYLISVAFVGLPLMLLEFIAGSSFKVPLSPAFAKISGRFASLSTPFHLFNLLILSYYVVVTGWILAYFALALLGQHVPFAALSGSSVFPFFTIIVIGLVSLAMNAGLRAGVEKANAFLLPVFFAILLLLIANSLTMPGLGRALSFYAYLGEITPATASAALAQALFSLSVGTGIMFTYAAHLKKGERLTGSALAASITDTLVALAAGIAVFPMVFTYGLNPAEGPELAFEALPKAFAAMPFGNIFMPLFFFLLFSAALTSALSMAEMTISDTSRAFGRKTAALYFMGLLLALSAPSMLSYSGFGLAIGGVPVLDYLDGTFVVALYPLVALLLVLLLAWGWKDMEKEAAKHIPLGFLSLFVFLVKFMVPGALLLLFIANFIL